MFLGINWAEDEIENTSIDLAVVLNETAHVVDECLKLVVLVLNDAKWTTESFECAIDVLLFFLGLLGFLNEFIRGMNVGIHDEIINRLILLNSFVCVTNCGDRRTWLGINEMTLISCLLVLTHEGDVLSKNAIITVCETDESVRSELSLLRLWWFESCLLNYGRSMLGSVFRLGHRWLGNRLLWCGWFHFENVGVGWHVLFDI